MRSSRFFAALLFAATLSVTPSLRAQPVVADPALAAEIDRRTAAIADKVTAWRHDIHQHPELGYAEKRTAALVAAHLKSLGLEVQENVGGIPGVVGILKGGKPGPTVALRADMDALPVTELVDVPFKSTVRTVYNGQETGVMHACGHDMHTAMLMGTAEVLAGLKDRIPGTVKFLFQPAEEVPPRGGAQPMIDAGVMKGVDGVFGLHVGPGPLGAMRYRAGAISASADGWRIVVHGRQGHGAMPSNTVDPIVVSAEIVTALQTIVSRQLDLSKAPAVVTVGAIHGGLRENIIPDSVWMIGTIRAFDPEARKTIHARMKRIATNIAEAHGATADVIVDIGYPSSVNNDAMVAKFFPTLKRVAGAAGATEGDVTMAGEDFSRFSELAPGFFFNLSVTPPNLDPKSVASNHSPLFQGDDRALAVGVRAMTNMAMDFLRSGGAPKLIP
ncbi:amidohydrolase [Gemmatimonas sp.]|uniref:amidohydrolase n=1 Tax=Gemmatimonas sp. TaxID=1962908 RepID=UPI00286B0F27|nr:amidohydrolase [Gemmatimonas sp.]